MTTTVHWRTPFVAANDPRGLSARQIACLRRAAGQPVETLITRHRHDAAGRRVEQWDPRLFESAASANQSTDYRLSGEPLKVDSVDAGWRLSLFGLAGEELQRWDARGGHWRITYDEQLRPIAIDENGRPNVENFFYADAGADSAFNVRGQLTEHLDSCGTLSFESYSLRGLPMRETRTLAGGDAFTSRRRYSPLGSTLSQTDAGDHQQQARYDLAGQLKQVDLLIKGGPAWQTVLNDAQYNAAGQIIEQQAGNHVLSTWTYDLGNGRLCTHRAQKETGPTLRDIEYFYDPVGNITRLEDHLFEPIHFANQRVDGHRD
ncbi:toxin, partial [Pseudomonas sp. NPDC086278]